MAKLNVCVLHKSGSMFLYKLFKSVAQRSRHAYVSINEPTYQTERLKEESYVHCPLRSFPDEIDPEQQYLFQVRDPRDCLVSEYYWFGYMAAPEEMPEPEHQQQIRDLTIDSYACKRMDASFAGLAPYVESTKNVIMQSESPNVSVVRYEEMVTDFSNWLRVAVHSLDLPESTISTLLQEFGPEFEGVQELTTDRILQGEKNFVRRMYPGDHLEKLQPETIEYVSERLHSYLSFFGYDDSG